MKLKFLLASTLSFLSGLGICLWVTETAHKREAWDAGLYYSAGMPLMCVLIFIFAYFLPKHSWRWTLFMALGQSTSGFVKGSDLSLWPLALIAMVILSLPQLGAGFLAAWLASKLRK